MPDRCYHLRIFLISLCLILISAWSNSLYAQEIIINEVMSSNSFTIADEDGDYEDWIELHNHGNVSVNLEGWFLSDDYENPQRWEIPAIIIPANGYVLIWASNKDRSDPGNELHTNFAISQAGEEILLSNPGGELVDELPPTEIPTDVSIGRKPGQFEDWFFFNEPTPGSENITPGYQDILQRPEFSVNPGFYNQAQLVEITHHDPEATIYFTLDGSAPNDSSFVYEEPIIMENRTGEENNFSTIPTNLITSGTAAWHEPSSTIRKANIIRAKAKRDGYMESDPIGGTWFIFPEGEETYTLPVISIIGDSTGFFGYDEGMYVPGQYGNEENFWHGNYAQRGHDWERKISFELFESNGELAFAQQAGARIHGGFSRRFPQKSLRMYARNDYGEQYFNYPLFPGQPYDQYKRFILRNSGNDWYNSLFVDALAQSLVRHFNVDTQQYRPTVVFLNGEYWGIHNIRERYDRHYLERVYGAEEGKIDLLSGWNQVKEGDNYHYKAFISFLENNDLSDNMKMDAVKTYMDLDNFLDYYSAQVYYGNNDWPQNNIDFWRYRSEYNPHAPEGLDGRWRWLMFDVDRSIGFATDVSFDMLEWLNGEVNEEFNVEWPNLIFLNLMENEQFKHDFINRIADHLNSAFNPERVAAFIDSLREPLLPEIEEHIDRWGAPTNLSIWNWNVNRMYTYAEQRPGHLRQHLIDHYDLGETVTLTLNNPHQPEGILQVNSMQLTEQTPGIRIENESWSGIYFENNPVTVTAHPAAGYRFSHWSGNVDRLSESELIRSTITFYPDSAQTLTPNYSEASTENEDQQLLAYWVFTADLPNDTPLTEIEPTFAHADLTSNGHEPMLSYQPAISPYPPDEGTAGIMDRVNDPTDLNYRSEWNNNISFEDSDMRGIRARNPSLVSGVESSITFHLPTTGYSDTEFSFAVKRTGSGQRELIVEYLTDVTQEWTSDGIDPSVIELFEPFSKIDISLEDVPTADDNPDFHIRFRFGGDTDIREGDSGNVRFNNISFTGILKEATSAPPAAELPAKHVLHQNYPNPFNPVTTVDFELPHPTHVQLNVYDMLGRRVATLVDGFKESGFHSTVFDASALSSGVYIYTLRTESAEIHRKMTLIK